MLVTISKTIPPTSMSRLTRSIAWETVRIGGQENNRGMTDQSFASTTSTNMIPSVTCSPCVTRYSQYGCVGQLNR